LPHQSHLRVEAVYDRKNSGRRPSEKEEGRPGRQVADLPRIGVAEPSRRSSARGEFATWRELTPFANSSPGQRPGRKSQWRFQNSERVREQNLDCSGNFIL